MNTEKLTGDVLRWGRQLGLSESSVRVYLFLLINGERSASDISDSIGIGRVQIYAILRTLVEYGLVVEMLTPVKMFRANPPREAFENLAISYRKTEEKRIKAVNDATEQIISLLSHLNPASKDLYRGGSAFEFVTGFRSILNAQRKIFLLAEKEICSISRPPYLFTSELFDVERKAYRRDVIFKIIYEQNVDTVTAINEDKKLIGEKISIKVIEKAPVKLLMADTSLAILSTQPITTPVRKLRVIRIRDKAFLGMLRDTFEYYWQRGVDTVV